VNNRRVTFIRPFVLKGLKEAQPAGTYSIETSAAVSDLFHFIRSKRASTSIRICRSFGIDGVLRNVDIDPLDLEAAQRRDAEPEVAKQAA
jgi:hypothetical protein